MVGHPLFVHDAIRTAVAGNHIVRMSAIGAPAVAKMLAPGDDAQSVLEPKLGSVNDDVSGILAFDFFVFGIQSRTVIDDGSLESGAFRPGKCTGRRWRRQ